MYLAKEGQGDEAREQILTAARQVFDTKMTDWGFTEKDEMFYEVNLVKLESKCQQST